ncbi:hypothetical protein [Nocardiopsis ansamitocini]|uniref:Uncharacterized protein n=1 Tax=Nocardiopsis ansamitocini TaxID=1670832 RepID=A0A9W6P9L2_9ACTN|nr:hypothetical protein [Nocardiopsis ansamitocini]GLU49506.1 hypothetical protein Nans01_38570 [Nocardiopsis ansamitocini]
MWRRRHRPNQLQALRAATRGTGALLIGAAALAATTGGAPADPPSPPLPEVGLPTASVPDTIPGPAQDLPGLGVEIYDDVVGCLEWITVVYGHFGYCHPPVPSPAPPTPSPSWSAQPSPPAPSPSPAPSVSAPPPAPATDPPAPSPGLAAPLFPVVVPPMPQPAPEPVPSAAEPAFPSAPPAPLTPPVRAELLTIVTEAHGAGDDRPSAGLSTPQTMAVMLIIIGVCVGASVGSSRSRSS